MSELVVQVRFLLERNHFASKSVPVQPRSAGSGEKKYSKLSWWCCKDCWTAVPVIKHHKWCWTVILEGRPSIKWDMACERCLSRRLLQQERKEKLVRCFGKTQKHHNMPLVVLQEVILDTGSVNAFSSLFRGFHFGKFGFENFKKFLFPEHGRYFVFYMPVPLWMRFVNRSDLYGNYWSIWRVGIPP